MCIINKIKPANPETRDVPSPRNIIPKSDIHFNAAEKRITISNVELVWLSDVADTNSMDPVVDENDTTLLTKKYLPEDLAVGDIIVYWNGAIVIWNGAPAGKLILHRIIKIEHDEQGRKFTCKGDNNYRPDPYGIRDSHLRYLYFGVIH